MSVIQSFLFVTLLCAITISCKKDTEVQDADYSDQLIYMPAAVDLTSNRGVYEINKVAVPGQVYRYDIDAINKKFTIPLSVNRSGVNARGNVPVVISINTDTVSKFISAGRLPSNTLILPTDKFTFPSTIVINDGKYREGFTISVDLNLLIGDTSRKYAVGISMASEERKTGLYGTLLLMIDPAFLVPSAKFSTSVSARTVSFNNSSVNAISYAWDYGDGSPISTEKAASHVFAAAGTYTIKLIAYGALGDLNKAMFSATIVVP